MQNKLKIIALILIIIGFAISCNQEKCSSTKSKEKTANTYTDSELALLMRDMFLEVEQMKMQIANNEPLSMNLDHKKILSAHATEPEKAASPEFKAFAHSYLQIKESLESADSIQMPELYDNLVVACMSCHKAMCPGPLVRIKKLKR